jgi:anaerobic nitric oxide reductase transcription regulator
MPPGLPQLRRPARIRGRERAVRPREGAFTGAIHNRAGKFELADKHSVSRRDRELSLALQAKLLRVLQYGDLQRIGDDTPLKVNVRILAATNRDLKQAVVEGSFGPTSTTG